MSTLLQMFVLGYLCIKLVLAPQLGLGATVFVLAGAAALLYWLHANKLRLARESLIYLALILLDAAYFSLYDNPTLKALALLLLPLLTAYFIATVSNIRLEGKLGAYFPADLADTLLLRPLQHAGAGPRLLKERGKNTARGHNILLVLLGLTLAIPACLVVGGLLTSADIAFANLWERLSDAFLADMWTEMLLLLLSLPISCYFFAILSGSLAPRRELTGAQQLAEKARFVPGLLALSALTPLLIIYALFFISQSAYFLSAFSGLVPQGYNYAEYARRGFFELCTVSGLNLAAIFGLRCFCKQGVGRVYQVYTMLLSLSSLALIVISLRKMMLYIQIYGLTPLRVYTSWFMLLLALIFLFVIAKTFIPRFAVGKWTAIATVAMFFILCFANPDLQIARYNVRGYAEGRLPELDVAVLGELGDAAAPYLLEITQMEKATAEDKQLAGELLRRKQPGGAQDWREFNLASWQAVKSML